MIFASNSPCKSYENEQNPYFSDFECNFRLLGGVFHKCSKSKYHRFHKKLSSGNGLKPIIALLKREKLLSTNDHILTPDILSLNKLIISGKIIQKAKQAINLV